MQITFFFVNFTITFNLYSFQSRLIGKFYHRGLLFIDLSKTTPVYPNNRCSTVIVKTAIRYFCLGFPLARFCGNVAHLVSIISNRNIESLLLINARWNLIVQYLTERIINNSWMINKLYKTKFKILCIISMLLSLIIIYNTYIHSMQD